MEDGRRGGEPYRGDGVARPAARPDAQGDVGHMMAVPATPAATGPAGSPVMIAGRRAPVGPTRGLRDGCAATLRQISVASGYCGIG
ncbi:hypothetical protein GCM10010106_46590 [Thermopolyspora flexuosa]|nr:hypothetical protein GCM10010106_46590 [Thermopolyspora flexuosa]